MEGYAFMCYDPRGVGVGVGGVVNLGERFLPLVVDDGIII